MKDDDKVVCPACSSTHVHAHPRGFSWMSGLFGSPGVRITCLRCGHKFLPGGAPLRSATPWVLGGLFATGLVLFLLVQVGQGIERDQEVTSAYTPAYSAPVNGCDGRSGLPDILAPNDPWIIGGETCLAWAQGRTEQQQFNEHKALYTAFAAALAGHPLNTQLGRDEAQWLKGVEDSDPEEFQRILRQYGTEIADVSTQGGAK